MESSVLSAQLCCKPRTCSSAQKAEIRRITVQSQPWQIGCEILSQKYPTQKRDGEMAQAVECLPSKHEAKFKPQRERERERERENRAYLK
jgi:hypothetical protein